jgi:hypothetical protein
MGRLHAAAGRRDEAARALERAVDIIERANAEPSSLPDLPYLLSAALSQSAAVIGLGRAELTPTERADRQALADRAVAALRQAIAGEFKVVLDPEIAPTFRGGFKNVRYLEVSATFDVLRSRSDFQLLLQDLAFPTWPFEGDPP